MDPYSYRIEEIRPETDARRESVREFLQRQGLELDAGIETYYAVYRGDTIVGGVGRDGAVIKGAAVAPDHRGEGILGAVVTRLVTDLRRRTDASLFVYTVPANRAVFQELGFHPVAATDAVVLLESDAGAFPAYLDGIRRHRGDGVAGSLVMNCNPFTLGHRYLAEQAAAACDRVLLFLVEEDRSEFPFAVRLRLVREGTAHLPNVTVLPGGPYIISSATFPTYFLKDASDAARVHSELDLRIFGTAIAPAGGIGLRFAGEEPFSPVTALYNDAMQRILPELGVAVTILPRCSTDDGCISASAVRRLLAEGRPEATAPLVPETTYRFLISPEAAPIVARIRAMSPAIG